MLLLADIGNSETLLGVRNARGEIERRWRTRSDPRSTPDEIGVLLRQWLEALPGGASSLEAFCAASVVPNYTHVLAEAAERHLGIGLREFRWSPELGIGLEVDEPERVGADRVANALGAHLAYPGPAIVVDFGTATTFDVVSATGNFLGGAIAAGIEVAAASLFGRTALLPRIALGFPDSAIGKSTVQNLQIGLYHGATLLVDGLVERIRLEWEPKARVIATGGLAQRIAPHCASVNVVDPDLTLKGVGWGHDRLHPTSI
ncbi:MAG TPA: type III pantothenate kinase [Gemmatimonadota bacterium]|nr:type III pantothenate kinase [Gemmatimonadota bacterium]